MAKKTVTEKNFAGLDYVTVSDIPIKETRHGIVWDIDYADLERQVAIQLIENRVPIRGVEFKLIQSALNFRNIEMAEELGVHYNTVCNWRKREKSFEHLAQPDQVSIRLLAAEILGVSLSPRLGDLRSKVKVKKLKVKVA